MKCILEFLKADWSNKEELLSQLMYSVWCIGINVMEQSLTTSIKIRRDFR